MENEKNMCSEKCGEKCQHKCRKGRGGLSGGAYGLGFIGALIFFIENSTTFWIGVLGVLKAVVWPAVLVYKLLAFLN